DSELVSSEVMEIVTPEVGGIKESNDNPIPSYDPSISGTPPNLTPSGESDFFLEVDAFLAVEDESTSSQFPKSDLDPKGDILLFESFLNDDPSSESHTKSSATSLNSLLEETNNFHNSLPESATETFSPSPILVKDSDSLIEEIDLLCTPDYPMPPGIEDEDSDSERDILIPKDLPSNNSLSFVEKESIHSDIPPFSRPSAKPPDEQSSLGCSFVPFLSP
nr:reverse transcriptase domain-containing protein [Tanacetum cinerariifolium]